MAREGTTADVAPRRRAGTRRSAGPALVAAALAVLAVVAPVAAAVEPWSHYDTGRVDVVFPSSLPVVDLVQDANASVSATLAVTGIYELAPGGFPHPTVVAAAFPTSATAFNESSGSGAPGAPVAFDAELWVFPVNLSLWSPGVALGPTGGPIGAATLDLAFAPVNGTSTAAGVSVAWSVAGWPYAAPGDLLAVALSFGYASGAALTACSASSLLYRAPPCAGSSVAPGSFLWGSQYASLEGEGSGGPVAVVNWSSSILFGSATAPVTVGATATGPGSGTVLVAAPHVGSTPASGTLGFALVAPALGGLAAGLLTGNAVAFAGAGAALVAWVAAGFVAYRRHDRRVRAGL